MCTASPTRRDTAHGDHEPRRTGEAPRPFDALTLWGELLTVAVVDAATYDELFGDMVDSNDEGVVVKTGQARPTPHLPFTEHVVMELLASGRLAPAAAGCLELAWRHRKTILGAS